MLSLPEARRRASSAEPAAPRRSPVGSAVGLITAEEIRTRLDIPHVSTSAMDGWAVAEPAGDGGWEVIPQRAEGPADLLPDLQPGQAAGVVTGSPIPAGAVSVLRQEHSEQHGESLSAAADTPDLEPGRNIRPRGVEAEQGTLLLPAGARMTPARAAAAAVAGYDDVLVRPAPTVRLILTGTEVITAGIPEPGQVRDVFGVALPSMLAALGAEASASVRLTDDLSLMLEQLQAADEDIIITTGGTAHSRADVLRPALEQLGADIIVDSVNMRPGHPALLARLGRTWVLGLPGNPLAGFAALTALGGPLIAALSGRTAPSLQLTAAERLTGARRGLRLLPARTGHDGVQASGHDKSHMMRGLADADLFAIVPPEGIEPGQAVECLEVPGALAPLRRTHEEQ